MKVQLQYVDWPRVVDLVIDFWTPGLWQARSVPDRYSRKGICIASGTYSMRAGLSAGMRANITVGRYDVWPAEVHLFVLEQVSKIVKLRVLVRDKIRIRTRK
jgi:hypothetical protein